MEESLEERFRKHLLATVGKKPTKKEMASINKKLRVDFNYIYAKPDRSPTAIKEAYNKRLSRLWARVVADDASFSEVRLLLKYVRIVPSSSIASVGSGLAVFELFLAKELAPQGTVYCIDISSGMSKRAAKLAKKLRCRNAKIITSSATKIPLLSSSQDIVLARRTGLSNDKKWRTVLREARRVMKNNARSRFVYTVDSDFNRPSTKIKANLKNANLKFISIKGFRKGNGGLVYMVIARP